MKREHDASPEHDEATSSPTKWKWLFIMLTEFDEEYGEDLNEHDPDDISYHAKDDVSDEEDHEDGLRYLGTEPGARKMAELVNITCHHQWDLDSSWSTMLKGGSSKHTGSHWKASQTRKGTAQPFWCRSWSKLISQTSSQWIRYTRRPKSSWIVA